MKPSFKLLAVLLFFPAALNAQTPNLPFSPRDLVNGMTQHSPEATAVAKYAMTPPNLNTGTPVQNINVYNITDNGASFSLNANYSYSGFRPGETVPCLGLGWSLSEATIVRTVRGLPDESSNIPGKKFEDMDYDNLPEDIQSLATASNFPANSYNITANRINYKIDDGAPDEYIYSIEGYSGRFVWLDGQAIMYPYTGVKISKDNAQSGGFNIITPEGLKYKFKEADWVNEQKHWDAQNEVYINKYFAPSCDGIAEWPTYADDGYTTTWKPEFIENLNTHSKIFFTYTSYSETKTFDGSHLSSMFFWTTANSLERPLAYGNKSVIDDHPSTQKNTFSYLTKITSDNYVIDFLYNAGGGNPFEHALENIKVYNRNDGTPIFTADIQQEFLLSGASRVLKSIALKGQGRSQKYDFSYNDDNYGGGSTLNVDHWGYANGANNTHLIPEFAAVTSLLSSGAFASYLNMGSVVWANRSPNFSYAVFGALTEVTYPTGGKTTYTYESANGRGIRVKSLSDNASYNAPVVSKYYSYYPEPDTAWAQYRSYTYMEWGSDHTDHGCPATGPANWWTPRYLLLAGADNASLEALAAFPVQYTEVKEYLGSPSGANGRNVYSYNYVYPDEAKLVNVKSYNNTGILKKESRIGYTIQNLRTIKYFMSPVLYQPGTTTPCFDVLFGNPVMLFPCDVADPYYHFVMAREGDIVMTKLPLLSNWYKKTSEEEIVYTDAGNISTTNTYTYASVSGGSPRYTVPVKIESQNSKGDQTRLNIYYPGDEHPDYPNLLMGPEQMWNPGNANFKSLLNEPLLKRRMVDGNVQENLLSTYQYDPGSNLVTLIQELHTNSSGNLLKKMFPVYDNKSRLIQLQVQNSITSYIWGYNKQFTVANVKNAQESDVSYTSFETGEFNKFTVYGGTSQCTNVDKLTGEKAYNITAGLSSGMLDPAKKYIISVWAKNGIPEVTVTTSGGFSLALGTTFWSQKESVNGWTLLEYEFTGNSKIEMSGGGLIDELRIYPAVAQMSTTCYASDGRVTTICDARNQLTCYEYDNDGRLTFIRNAAGEILKKIEYGMQAAE